MRLKEITFTFKGGAESMSVLLCGIVYNEGHGHNAESNY